MWPQTPFFLLAAGILSLAALWLAFTEYSGRQSGTDKLTFLVLLNLCSFFLFTKGILHERTLEQKYALFVVVFAILSFWYLYSQNGITVLTFQLLVWLYSAYIVVIGASIIYLRKSLPWRSYKRLLSGELDLFCYHIGLSCEVLFFIAQYAAFAYLLSTNPIGIKLLLVIWLVTGRGWPKSDALLVLTSLLCLCAFTSLLDRPNLSGISIFAATLTKSVFLYLHRQFQWTALPTAPPRRVSVE
ncbi:hypothetical protein NEHOM01_2138 [Nematocida homosporus]|uniref:uncharacterized protein n=1 Tax=Nematocida homosporus TaxID=1912981 RepID=UPI0022205101|nr:uncharacterized protein NEHOM01_2138 [Nematocida homosporus]KAI5187388.1 hypothetical protein NEHOM01_2138 [Nematocida homosporus]